VARRPVRIGAFSGYLGDRYSALDEAMSGDPVDVLIGDYLAEITLAGLSSRRTGTGWIDYAARQLTPHLAAIAGRGIRVVTNAGGFDPAGMARVLRSAAAERGAAIRVAHITGDDVSGRVSELVGRRELGERILLLRRLIVRDHRDRRVRPVPDATVRKPAVENSAPRHTLAPRPSADVHRRRDIPRRGLV
jgi:hypothetical protein